MKAYRIDGQARIEGIPKCAAGLTLHSVDRPEPGTGEVLIRVRAASINFHDILTVLGRNPGLPERVPLSDGAGEIEKIGTGVTRFRKGDRVAGNFHQGWICGELTPEVARSVLGVDRDGMLSEYVVLGEHGAVKTPSHLSFEEAATLPCAALTAWTALTVHRAIEPGETVLVQGTGGVSIFALQFAKALGGDVIATTSSARKGQLLRALGADKIVDYVANPDWETEVLRLTQGRGVDRVIEVAGTLEQSLRCLRFGGRIVMIGAVGGVSKVKPVEAILRGATLHTAFVGNRDGFDAMNRIIEEKRIVPLVDRVFGFSQASDAYRYFFIRAHVGKVVIAI